MPEATMYAWSPIRHGAKKDKDGNIVGAEEVKMGDSVSQSKLGVDDDNWNALVEAGSVRPYKYPDNVKSDESAVQSLQRQAREASEAAEAPVTAMMSLGGSYFGPTPEEVMMNPELVTGEALEKQSEENAKEGSKK